jgi:hypothetical protein
MKTLLLLSLFSFTAFALPPVKCESGDIKLTIVENAKGEIYMTYLLESVIADGIVDTKEVDLIAKFPNAGEMTLVAKMGKDSKDNYLFFKGQRRALSCK